MNNTTVTKDQARAILAIASGLVADCECLENAYNDHDYSYIVEQIEYLATEFTRASKRLERVLDR